LVTKVYQQIPIYFKKSRSWCSNTFIDHFTN